MIEFGQKIQSPIKPEAKKLISSNSPRTAMVQAIPIPASRTTNIPPTLSRLNSLALFFTSS